MLLLGIASIFSLSSFNTREVQQSTSSYFSAFSTLSFVDLNIEDKNRWTPLHHAVRNNAVNSIEFLLDHGVDDIRLNQQREAAIHLAVIHNQLKALEVGCQASFDVGNNVSVPFYRRVFKKMEVHESTHIGRQNICRSSNIEEKE